VDRTTLLWTIVLFFGASIMFGLIRRATEDSSTAVTVGAQVAALALLIGAIVAFVRRSQR
jgi:lipopolysaccharide export LptBFGC system permease protein LptF